MIYSTSLVILLFAFFAPVVSFGASFCGKLDFRELSNSDLEQIVYVDYLSRGIAPKQCGIPGETLNICSLCASDISETQMRALRPLLGSKSHSDWHAKWHKVRSNGEKISNGLFEKLKAEKLVPANATRNDFLGLYKQRGSLAGENFFFMHRLMIKMVQMELALNGLPCIAPWKTLPDSIDDLHWPVPRFHRSEEERIEDQEKLEQLRARLNKYQDQQILRRISLNNLGMMLEGELHQELHQFYRSDPKDSPEALAQGFNDDLLPVETSPVNKYFWKIHGLVDDILGLWLNANGYQSIATQCEGKPQCFEWKATWVGKYPEALD